MKPQSLDINDLGVIKYDDKAKVGIKYKVRVSNARIPVFEDTDYSRYLKLPNSFSKDMRKLAILLAGEGLNNKRANSLANNLKQKYKYAITEEDNSATDGASPLEKFLFTRKTGTCEHFATALTLMLRAIGIPARFVTGFSGAEWNSIGNYYAVRAKSAHAWTEAFIDEQWVVFDATPASQNATQAEGLDNWTMMIDAFRMHWHKHVIGYDTSSQIKLAVALKNYLSEIKKIEQNASSFRVNYWLLGGGIIVVLIAFFLLRRRLIRQRQIRFKSTDVHFIRRTSNAIALLNHLEKILIKQGIARKLSQTPYEFLSEIKDKKPDSFEIANSIITKYHQVRFGGVELPDVELKTCKVKMRAL